MSTKSPTKKPSLMMRLFSTERKSSLIPATNDDDDAHEPLSPAAEEKLRQRRQRLQRLHSMDAATFRDRSKVLDGLDSAAAAAAKHEMRRATTASGGISSPTSPDAHGRRPSSAAGGKHQHSQRKGSVQIAEKQQQPGEAVGNGNGNGRSSSGSTSSDRSPTTPKSSPASPISPPFAPNKASDGTAINGQPEVTIGKRMSLTSSSSMSPDPTKNRVHPLLEAKPRTDGKKVKKLKHKKAKTQATTPTSGIKVDTSRPLDFPTTPETILEYHRQKPFLKANEEWLVVELNEFECLVDSMEIIKIIAKHSKFFEVEPDQLWEEFFEFVEDVPSYDEIINYDVWQEFRDQKYPC